MKKIGLFLFIVLFSSSLLAQNTETIGVLSGSNLFLSYVSLDFAMKDYLKTSPKKKNKEIFQSFKNLFTLNKNTLSKIQWNEKDSKVAQEMIKAYELLIQQTEAFQQFIQGDKKALKQAKKYQKEAWNLINKLLTNK